MSFIHIFPGHVDTPLGKNLHWSLYGLIKMWSFAARSMTDCGEWMASALLAPEYKHGAFHMNQNADPFSAGRLPDMSIGRQELLDHYTKEVDV